MPTYIYKGVSKEQRDFMMKAHMASVKPQDPRGRKPVYHIDAKDSEELKEKKRARKKKWMGEREAEYKKTIDKLDAEVTLSDQRGKQFTFTKGKPVKLEQHNRLVPKLEGRVAQVDVPFPQWEKVAEKAETEKTPEKK